MLLSPWMESSTSIHHHFSISCFYPLPIVINFHSFCSQVRGNCFEFCTQDSNFSGNVSYVVLFSDYHARDLPYHPLLET